MNIQFGQANNTRSAGSDITLRLWPKMWFAVKMALFCLAVAALFNGNIYLRQKITEQRVIHPCGQIKRDKEHRTDD